MTNKRKPDTQDFNNKLYFSPKLREETKKNFEKLAESLKQHWDKTDQELIALNIGSRETLVSLASTSAKFLKLIKKIDEWNFKRKIKDKKFSLYNHNNSNKILMEMRFTRTNTGEKAIETWILPQGLPTKTNKTKAIRYKRSLGKKGYTLAATGTHFQALYSIDLGRYMFKSKKQNLVLYIQFPSDNQYLLSLTKD